MPAIRYPIRYRPLPHGPQEFDALKAECRALLEEATVLDATQRALAVQLARVRTKLAEIRLTMWPRIDRNQITHGFRITLRGGPPPIPPVAPGARQLTGRHLRSAILAILARNGTKMTLVEIHRELHLNGYAIASREPVHRLANALAYEHVKGRARRVERGTYALGVLNPGERRRIGHIELTNVRATSRA